LGCTSVSKSVTCIQNVNACPAAFTTGNGNTSFTWTASGSAGISYGPLVTGACFSLTLQLTVTTGLAAFVVQINPSLNVTSTDTKDTIVVAGCINDPTPLIANFDYRVLCSPIGIDLPTNRLRVVDDITCQMSENPLRTVNQLAQSLEAYFQLNPRDAPDWVDGKNTYELLDLLMEQIPGKDNYDSFLNESIEGEVAYHYVKDQNVLNAAYYSRFYSLKKKKDVMGRDKRRRAFNDINLFTARTTQRDIAALAIPDPVTGEVIKHKYSYAIPLEIVYQTPLASWNPYKLKVTQQPNVLGAPIRSGGMSSETAFLDISENERFYWTPSEFFEDESTTETVGVMDANGVVRSVRASGIRTILPKIKGVPQLIRQRYPIPPLSFNKNFGVMNAKALKHIFSTNQSEELIKSELHLPQPDLWIWTSMSNNSAVPHWHRVDITEKMRKIWDQNETARIVIPSGKANRHFHTLTITRLKGPNGFTYTLVDCDKKGSVCVDGHTKFCFTDKSCR